MPDGLQEQVAQAGRAQRTLYAAVEVRTPDRFEARACIVCGAFATTNEAYDSGDGRVMGQLPEVCRREHGNYSVPVALVPASTQEPKP